MSYSRRLHFFWEISKITTSTSPTCTCFPCCVKNINFPRIFFGHRKSKFVRSSPFLLSDGSVWLLDKYTDGEFSCEVCHYLFICCHNLLSNKLLHFLFQTKVCPNYIFIGKNPNSFFRFTNFFSIFCMSAFLATELRVFP